MLLMRLQKLNTWGRPAGPRAQRPEPGDGATSTGVRGESGGAECGQEGMTSLQDLGVETMN